MSGEETGREVDGGMLEEAPPEDASGAEPDPGPWGEEAVKLGGPDPERERRVEMVAARKHRLPALPRRLAIGIVALAGVAILAASAIVFTRGPADEAVNSAIADRDAAQAAARLKAQDAAQTHRWRAQRRLADRRAARRQALRRRQRAQTRAATAQADAPSPPPAPTYEPPPSTSASAPQDAPSSPPPASGEAVEREFGFER